MAGLQPRPPRRPYRPATTGNADDDFSERKRHARRSDTRLNLGPITAESRKLADAIKPGTGTWDVIVVGSGAAGGMAAFQLAMAGVKVLLLEAGRMIDTRVEYRTMEWPYTSMRRNRLPPGERPIAVAEYNFLDRSYGSNPALAKYKKVQSYAANTFTRNWLPDERENPHTGTPYALVRARILGGRTNFWGRGALRYGPMQFKAASLDGFDVDWPISLRRREALLRQGRHAARVLRHERRARAGAGRRVPASVQAQLRRSRVQALDWKTGPHADSRPRGRHDRRRAEQQVPIRVSRARALRPWLQSAVGLPFAERAHLSGA